MCVFGISVISRLSSCDVSSMYEGTGALSDMGNRDQFHVV